MPSDSSAVAAAEAHRLTAAGWYCYRRRVGWTDVDPSANYQFTAVLRFVEEAEIAMLREAGVLDALYPHLPRTFVRADFRSAAHFDDEVTVQIRLRRLGRTSIEYDFRVCQGAQLCAEGSLGTAHVDENGIPAVLPHHVRDRLDGPTPAANGADACR